MSLFSDRHEDLSLHYFVLDPGQTQWSAPTIFTILFIYANPVQSFSSFLCILRDPCAKSSFSSLSCSSMLIPSNLFLLFSAFAAISARDLLFLPYPVHLVNPVQAFSYFLCILRDLCARFFLFFLVSRDSLVFRLPLGLYLYAL